MHLLGVLRSSRCCLLDILPGLDNLGFLPEGGVLTLMLLLLHKLPIESRQVLATDGKG